MKIDSLTGEAATHGQFGVHRNWLSPAARMRTTIILLMCLPPWPTAALAQSAAMASGAIDDWEHTHQVVVTRAARDHVLQEVKPITKNYSAPRPGDTATSETDPSPAVHNYLDTQLNARPGWAFPRIPLLTPLADDFAMDFGFRPKLDKLCRVVFTYVHNVDSVIVDGESETPASEFFVLPGTRRYSGIQATAQVCSGTFNAVPGLDAKVSC